MSQVTEITDGRQHLNFINSHDKVLIFFGSEGCGHCRSMVPIYSKLANKYPNVSFAHVETTKVYTEGTDKVPIFIAYENQIPSDTVLGSDENRLINLIESISK